jgi:hypothetical protein
LPVAAVNLEKATWTGWCGNFFFLFFLTYNTIFVVNIINKFKFTKNTKFEIIEPLKNFTLRDVIISATNYSLKDMFLDRQIFAIYSFIS